MAIKKSGKHGPVIRDALAILHRRFAQDDKTDGYRKDGPVSVAKFEIGEADEPKQREARVLRQRQVSDVIEQVHSGELCWTTATSDFDPFTSEYEGYMGNYGNTLERWYHRAAIVLSRRKKAAGGKSKRPARKSPRRSSGRR